MEAIGVIPYSNYTLTFSSPPPFKPNVYIGLAYSPTKGHIKPHEGPYYHKLCMAGEYVARGSRSQWH